MTIVIAAVIVGLLVGVAFLPAGVFWALPIALVLIGILGAGAFRRRVAERQSMKNLREEADSNPIEFTARDRQTLVD